MDGKHHYCNLVKQHALGTKGGPCMSMNLTQFASKTSSPHPASLNSTQMPVSERPQFGPQE